MRVKPRCQVWQRENEEGWAGLRVQGGALPAKPALMPLRLQDPEGPRMGSSMARGNRELSPRLAALLQVS